MKLRLLAFILLLVQVQNPAPAGTITGRILKTGSGDPIPNTPVTLISSSGLSDEALDSLLTQISQVVTIGLQGGGGGGSQDLTIRQVTTLLQSAGPGVGTQASMLTDRVGHFEFTNLSPGRYTVWVQRFNYFGPLLNGMPTSTASATLTLDGSKPVPAVDLFMTQGMAISGRVLDTLGQPASGMPITAFRATYTDGKPQWAPVVSRPIDDRGEYRLSPLPPGEYYLGVTPPQNNPTADGQALPIRTFFPGVSEPSQATKLVLKSSDAPRVDFTLRSAPATVFKISGFAVNPAPTRNAAGVVDNGFSDFVLMPAEAHLIDSFSSNTFANVVSADRRAAGEFELQNVRPGVYELYPIASVRGFPSGRTLVDVRGSDALGVRIPVSSAISVAGRVTVAAGNPQTPVNLDSIRIVLKPWNTSPIFGSGASVVPTTESGQFALTGPAGVQVTLQVSGLPETAFVSDILAGTDSVLNGPFPLSSASPLQIVIDATTAATVDTTVRTGDGRPAPRARVVLVPAQDQRQTLSRYKTGITDSEGHLILRGIAPNTYTAFAWESIPDTAWQNLEFLAKYTDLGTAVTLAPGAQAKLQLKWIAFETDQH